MNPNLLFEQLIAQHDLDSKQMQEAIHACMSGQLNDLQITAFLALMRMKGETTTELSAAAYAMQELARPISLGKDLMDIVGTGGDAKNTFNVSTACSFVVAASGFKVAKHGNRSVSSRSGSADLLEHAGFVLNLSDQDMQTCMRECNLTFLFAPQYHPVMMCVQEARKQLGIRTLFNLLGPLINPACVQRHVVGVFSKIWLKPLAEVLAHLGSQRALVLHAQDGLDEISITQATAVLEYNQGRYTEWFIHPKEYGLQHAALDEIVVDSPEQSLRLIETALSGEPGPARDMVVLNSAAALYCAQDGLAFQAAIEQAQKTIDSGKAKACFSHLRSLTQTLGKESKHD